MPPNDHQSQDEAWMAVAIRMAERGWGRTAPNPSVGAVIVDEARGVVLSRGWTQAGGRPHAEVEAIARASGSVRGATIFVTLEPCAHYGKTPPCVDAILEAGLGRVVCGIEDPDPRVGGKGLNRLREAGIAVRRGVLREAANWVTLGHILRVTERRPLVQLKLAVNSDGCVPRGGVGQPTWVTSETARAHGHLLRARADAILVGSGTVRDDNPSLTCRLPGLGERSPIRVVLSREPMTEAAECLLSSADDVPLWWFGSGAMPAERWEQLEGRGAIVHRVREVGGRLWLPAVMEVLVQNGVTRLLVEGGETVWSAFDRIGMVDEVVLFHARDASGRPVADEAAHRAIRRFVPEADLAQALRREAGQDDIFHFRRRVLSQ